MRTTRPLADRTSVWTQRAGEGWDHLGAGRWGEKRVTRVESRECCGSCGLIFFGGKSGRIVRWGKVRVVGGKSGRVWGDGRGSLSLRRTIHSSRFRIRSFLVVRDRVFATIVNVFQRIGTAVAVCVCGKDDQMVTSVFTSAFSISSGCVRARASLLTLILDQVVKRYPYRVYRSRVRALAGQLFSLKKILAHHALVAEERHRAHA